MEPRATFCPNLLEVHLQCYILNFNHLSPVVLKKILEYLLCISIVQTWDPLARGQLGPWDLHFTKLGKRPLGNATSEFKPYEPIGSVEEHFLKNVFMFFYGMNLGPPGGGHLGPWDLHLNKLGKGSPGNATCRISSTWVK